MIPNKATLLSSFGFEKAVAATKGDFQIQWLPLDSSNLSGAPRELYSKSMQDSPMLAGCLFLFIQGAGYGEDLRGWDVTVNVKPRGEFLVQMSHWNGGKVPWTLLNLRFWGLTLTGMFEVMGSNRSISWAWLPEHKKGTRRSGTVFQNTIWLFVT